MRFLCKEKLKKLLGKLEISGKTESAFFCGICIIIFFVLFVIVVKKFSEKKNRYNYKGKSGKLQKLWFFYAFSIITDDKNDIFD
jgi:hypothetical protein